MSPVLTLDVVANRVHPKLLLHLLDRLDDLIPHVVLTGKAVSCAFSLCHVTAQVVAELELPQACQSERFVAA